MSKLLFIDDDYASHVYHREMAESAGFQKERLFFFFEVNTAVTHLKAIFAESDSKDWPDYMFVDLNMPEKSGFDFLDDLKAEFTHDIIPPIYIVSTTKNQGDVNKVEEEPLIRGFKTKFLEQEFFESLLNEQKASDSGPSE